MENKSIIEFMVKFSELNEANQKYIMAIQQALAFAQESAEKDTCRKTKED